MSRLASEGQSELPLSEAGPRLLELSAEEIHSLRASDELGKFRDLVKQWKTRCESARVYEERQWLKNIDMYQGRQFTIWDDSRKLMREEEKLPWTVRIAVNIIEPICRTEMAKTGANSPTATVSPSSNDISDIMAAQAGQAAWEWFYRDQQFQSRVFSPANWWRTICGVSFVKTFWDPSAPDIAAGDAARREQATKQREQEQIEAATNVSFLPSAQAAPVAPLTTAPVVRGRVRAEFVSPFHLYIPDPAQLDLQAQPYVIHAYTKTVEQARLAYGDRLPAGWNPTPVSSNAIVDLSRLGILGASQSQIDSVLVLEAYVKPGYSALLPDGGMVMLVGDEVVHLAKEGLPYQHGEYPFGMLTGIENGKFYRKSVVESVTPLQNELNHTWGQIIKRKNLTTAPQFFYDEGSLDPRRVNNKPGQFIPIRLGMRLPTPVPIQEIPAYVLQLLDRIKGTLDDISGQHQVSRAISPGADTAASALALLQETDDNFLSATFDSIDTCMETCGRHSLSLMVQFWDEPRLIKITGGDLSFDTKMLRGADLVNGTDLRMESGSSLPLSKSARIATITEWVDKGMIPADVGLEAMEQGTLGKVYQRLKIDAAQAQQENIEMRDLDVAEVQQQLAAHQALVEAMPPQIDPMSGQAAPPPPPDLYPIGWMDNDAVHINEHKAFAKGQAFKQLPPEIQQVFELHTAAHEARLQQAMMAQAMMGAGQPDGYADQQQMNVAPAA